VSYSERDGQVAEQEEWFVCYHCKSDDCANCVGVPCACDCPIPEKDRAEYIAEQIFFHVLMHGGKDNPFRSIASKWFVDQAAPRIRELLLALSPSPDCADSERKK
jgi:hypothetical protein